MSQQGRCNTREAFIDAVIKLIRAFEGRGYYLPKIFGMVRKELGSLSHTYGTTGKGLYGWVRALYHRAPVEMYSCPLYHNSGARAAHTCGLAHLCFS
jgi:hypothetical protein